MPRQKKKATKPVSDEDTKKGDSTPSPPTSQESSSAAEAGPQGASSSSSSAMSLSEMEEELYCILYPWEVGRTLEPWEAQVADEAEQMMTIIYLTDESDESCRRFHNALNYMMMAQLKLEFGDLFDDDGVKQMRKATQKRLRRGGSREEIEEDVYQVIMEIMMVKMEFHYKESVDTKLIKDVSNLIMEKVDSESDESVDQYLKSDLNGIMLTKMADEISNLVKKKMAEKSDVFKNYLRREQRRASNTEDYDDEVWQEFLKRRSKRSRAQGEATETSNEPRGFIGTRNPGYQSGDDEGDNVPSEGASGGATGAAQRGRSNLASEGVDDSASASEGVDESTGASEGVEESVGASEGVEESADASEGVEESAGASVDTDGTTGAQSGGSEGASAGAAPGGDDFFEHLKTQVRKLRRDLPGQHEVSESSKSVSSGVAEAGNTPIDADALFSKCMEDMKHLLIKERMLGVRMDCLNYLLGEALRNAALNFTVELKVLIRECQVQAFEIQLELLGALLHNEQVLVNLQDEAKYQRKREEEGLSDPEASAEETAAKYAVIEKVIQSDRILNKHLEDMLLFAQDMRKLYKYLGDG